MYNVINECFRENAGLIKGYYRNVLINKTRSDIPVVGSRVVLALNSRYNIGCDNNPTDILGTITSTTDCFNYVKWDDDTRNAYKVLDRDLIVVPDDFEIKTNKCKCCKSCKEEKEFSQFKKSDNSEDGYFPYCEECVDGLKTWQEDEWKRYFYKNSILAL